MNRLLVSVSVGALAALCSTTAMAQQAPPNERATTIDEVIVTAQRREQAAQDVGIALSVLSGESLVQLFGKVRPRIGARDTERIEAQRFGAGTPPP